MIAYKFLSRGAVGPFTGFRWPQPEAGVPGRWVRSTGPAAGVHGCRLEDLPYWLDDELWLAELDGEVRVGDHQVAGARGRLLARVEGWDGALSRALGEDCARRLRDEAVRALRAAGAARAAERLAAAPELAGIVAAAAASAGEVTGPAALTLGYAGDAAGCAHAGNAAGAAYVAARAAGVLEGGRQAEPEAFRAERARQAAWLAARLAPDPRAA